MSKFKITVARIEVDARGKQDEQVRITFQIDRAPISFQVPILLSIRDFDDTEVVRAAIGHSLNSRPKAKDGS